MMPSFRWVWVAAGVVLSLGMAVPVLAQGALGGRQVQEPRYACSTVVPQDAGHDLADLAKIGLDRAIQVARTAVPGTAVGSSLDDENGCVVYSVEIRSADGMVHDVKVDAGTGAIVHQEASRRQGLEEESGEHERGGEE